MMLGEEMLYSSIMHPPGDSLALGLFGKQHQHAHAGHPEYGNQQYAGYDDQNGIPAIHPQEDEQYPCEGETGQS